MYKSLLFVLLFVSLLPSEGSARTVILGFDGMDPKLAQQWIDSNDLPNFKKLAQNGHFQPLATSNPAQSPVAWSSFATGLNPGEHGIFDFIHRDPKTFDPVYSISGFKQPETFDLFGWDVPMSGPRIYNKRLGKPFWLTSEQSGNKSSVLRVPVTYPPDNISSMLSGMGVPDLLGTQGTYTFYATKYINKSEKGGNIIRVKVKNNRIETILNGPPSPISGEPLSMPFIMEKADTNSMNIVLNDTEINLKEGSWSDWIQVNFSYAGVFSLSGMIRLHLVESFPRVKLYVSPININPESAELPISNPPEFAAQLSQDIGLYHTLGMPEETWSLNDGMIDGETFLEMTKTILAEREKMFFKQLDDESIELLVEVFVQTDRVSHMFWRGHDPNHPVYSDSSELERNAIKWIYQEADRILGKTISKLNPEDKLIVLSDHGFAPYYKHVNLNRWLLDEGFLVLKTDNTESFSLKDVDWERSKAYAMGLNGIYFNQKNREVNGIVPAENTEQLSTEIISKLNKLVDPENNESVINYVYSRNEVYKGAESKNSPDLVVGYKRGYRASWQTVLGEAPKELFSTNTDMWSGDHCIDPVLVPGVLFTNFKFDPSNIEGIKNIGSLALSTLEKPILLEEEPHHSGILDVPRDAIITVLKPLQKYLPSIVALILTGLMLTLLLIGLASLIKLFPDIPVISKLLKSVISLALILIMFDASKNIFSGSYINDNDNVTISVLPTVYNELPQLKWRSLNKKPFNIEPLGKNKWTYRLNEYGIILSESDGYELLELSNKKQMFNKVQKNWWHSFLSNKAGYINDHSQVKAVTVYSTTHGKKYWWSWLIFGFIFSYLLFMKKLTK